MSNVVPLGDKHRNARALLSELLNSPDLKSCIIITLDNEGDIDASYYEVSRAILAYAGAMLTRLALEE